MSKKIIFILLLSLCALALASQTNTKKENKTTHLPMHLSPTPSLPSESTLNLIPSEINALPGQYNQIDLQLNSQGPKPDLLQIELAYDPAILTEVSITPKITSNTNIPLNNNNEKTGRLSYALDLTPSLSSSEIPVTLNFKVKPNTLQKQTTVYFLPKTAVSSKGINIPIKVAYGAKIFISSPSAQQTIF